MRDRLSLVTAPEGHQQQHARPVLARSRTGEILTRSRPGDWDAFAATACYAAGQCQYDLGCPFIDGCRWFFTRDQD